MRPRRCRPVAILLLTLHLAGCTSWQPTAISPREVIQDTRPSVIRLTKSDGTRVIVRDPMIGGDSITAIADPENCREISTETGQTMCIPETTRVGVAALDDVSEVAVGRASAGRTVLLVMGVGVTALAVAVAHAFSQPWTCSPPCGSP